MSREILDICRVGLLLVIENSRRDKDCRESYMIILSLYAIWEGENKWLKQNVDELAFLD